MITRRLCVSSSGESRCRATLMACLLALITSGVAAAQQPDSATPPTADDQPPAALDATTSEPAADASDEASAQPTRITPEVEQAITPLFQRIKNAQNIRTTVKLKLTNSIAGEVLDTNEGLFQIASKTPNLLALTVKFESDAVRMISTGDVLDIQLTRDHYVELEAPEAFASLIRAMPIQLGPQPEPMLWLSLAGVDAKMNLLAGVTSAELVDAEAVEGTPTTIVRATRSEGMQWDLHLLQGENPRPLSLAIDMTEMISKTNSFELPEGFSFLIRYDFELWDADQTLADDLFVFSPPKDAQKFDSIADYLLTQNPEHPLLGKPTPTFTAKTLAGEEVSLTESPGEVVILDFWATWCPPCVEALPELAGLAEKFADRGVRFYAVNVGEEQEAVEEFLKDRELELPVLLDPEGEISAAFAATAIPQTVLIGKGGRIEAVHVGFDADASAKLLTTEIETLLAGRRIYEAEEVEQLSEEEPAAEDESPGDEGAPAKADATEAAPADAPAAEQAEDAAVPADQASATAAESRSAS